MFKQEKQTFRTLWDWIQQTMYVILTLNLTSYSVYIIPVVIEDCSHQSPSRDALTSSWSGHLANGKNAC